MRFNSHPRVSTRVSRSIQNPFLQTSKDTMPVFPHVEPDTRMSTAARVFKAVFLYLFDLGMTSFLVPRGVPLNIRLATMIFIRLGAICSTGYVNFALVTTLKADRGVVEPSQLTMTTAQILGLPEVKCGRAKREITAGWEEFLLKMAAKDEVEQLQVDGILQLNQTKNMQLDEGDHVKRKTEEVKNFSTFLPKSLKLDDDLHLSEPMTEEAKPNLSSTLLPTDSSKLTDSLVDIFTEYFDLNQNYTGVDQEMEEMDFGEGSHINLLDKEIPDGSKVTDGVKEGNKSKAEKKQQQQEEPSKASRKGRGRKKVVELKCRSYFSRRDLLMVASGILLVLLLTCFMLGLGALVAWINSPQEGPQNPERNEVIRLEERETVV